MIKLQRMTLSLLLNFFTLSVGLLWAGLSQAAMLDPEAENEPLLMRLVGDLEDAGIDVAANLNARDVIRQRIERPRLGYFADLPLNSLVTSAELQNWETEFQDSEEIAAVAMLLPTNDQAETESVGSYAQFLERWLQAPDQNRYFVTYHMSDRAAATSLVATALANGLWVEEFVPGSPTEQVGRLYATAALRLAIDSRQARSYRSDITEFAYLGERVRRNSNSLFRDNGNNGGRGLAQTEPAVFLKESLGDEFTRSTVREIIVPGGVALGETAEIPNTIAAMRFDGERLYLTDIEAQQWSLPAMDNPSLKALYDFVRRSEAISSDAIVDIDAQGRVRISSALRDTDPGYAIMQADTQPFEFVVNLDVIKSVIVDMQVQWQLAEAVPSLNFITEFEVRFLSADNMRVAQTRAALEYEYNSAQDQVSYQDVWGRDSGRLTDKVDYAGLGNSVADVARYAGWVALFRGLAEQRVRFLDGRYEFLKIDKSGEPTPRRY